MPEKITRQDRAAEARRLQDEEGLTGIQVAERMGLSSTYAHELLTDPEGERNRARKRKGGAMTIQDQIDRDIERTKEKIERLEKELEEARRHLAQCEAARAAFNTEPVAAGE